MSPGEFRAITLRICGFILLGWLPPVLLVLVLGMPFDTAVACCTYIAALFALLLLSVLVAAQLRGTKNAETGDVDG